MGQEIERKFLVRKEKWQPEGEGVPYRQGYLSTEKTHTVRVRKAGDKGFLTIKGMTEGITRLEFEYEIPVKDAEIMLDTLCEDPLIEKHRHRLEHEGMVWEVDVFMAENEGLVLAEVELESESQEIAFPQWVGPEVSADPRYYNANLVKSPFKDWQDD
ncbi:MAG: CYTH domain-containing protein [Deltaproteobacteria bacterium]|nr:CYTH domain-containing protein [Deltaproteobacteria bacterium]